MAKDDEAEFETVINWQSLLSAENDADLAELLSSPVENAITILKEFVFPFFRTGREIQKLSIIRTLSELLENNGEQVVDKVIPVLQQVLNDECSNLDIQCEAAITYKNIYRNIELTARIPIIGSVILNSMLQNATQQKDNLTAAAWLETLVEIIGHIPVQHLKQFVLPLTISQAQTSQRVQRRILATKLVGKLCANMEPTDIQYEIIPCVQLLCSDPNASVRNSIAQNLGDVVKSLQNTNDCAKMLVPCLVELCKDADIGTRETALDTVAHCIPFLSKETCKYSIVPLLKYCTEQAIIAEDETLNVVSKNLGQWTYLLKDVLTTRDFSWFFDSYVAIVGVPDRSSSSNIDGTCSSNIRVTTRRMCAYNFPCMILIYGEDYFKNRLLPILESFCSDPDDGIRSATAAGFHEVVKLLPDEPALIPPFFDLIRGSSAEVVGHLMRNLDEILPVLYKCVSKQNNCKISRVQLDRLIIGCCRMIRGTSFWRAQHCYLQNIAVLRFLIPINDLFVSFVPVLKQEVLTTRPIPCRVAASITLLLFMRQNPSRTARQSVIDFFIHSVAKHQNCHRRRLFLDVTPEVISVFSRKFFHTNFLTPVLEMANDKVANIRLQLCHILPKIKANLYLPQDEEILRQLEKIVRDLLCKEQNSSTRQLIQAYACDLSRAETRIKVDKSDQQKEEAENEIWDQEKAATQTIESGSSESDGVAIKEHLNEKVVKQKNAERLEKNLWHTHVQQTRTAVVRPQPHVVITQRSPSPMPRNISFNTATAEEKKLRLSATSQRSCKHEFGKKQKILVSPSLSVPLRQSHDEEISKAIFEMSGISACASSANHSSSSSIAPSSLLTSQRLHKLMPSKSASSVRSYNQGLIKVRSFSNIARTPNHLSVKVRTIK
ncbi:unnamed protein product [Thelazia callipaeda]|uniref:Serine/threonine-protein phosphatase 4 regulatory subunit 4 n=1 Tax=Thelazia callipaeda TaxID=103827 RepID=A0A158RCM0_THECL|nr:unnamed protein product [Thelazia callipaeda]